MGAAKARIKVERDWLNSGDGQMNTRRRRREESRGLLTYFNHFSNSGGKPCGPCLKALSPRLAYQFKIKKSSL